jgi:glycosyltransferase involved in cell wall biosynthesis
MDISIIIPTYNRLWSLKKTIQSCGETKLLTEIIVIDDGSTDDTATWLKAQSDLVVISQNNQGKDWAVNNGFGIAKGKYIRFIDSDDWIFPFSTDALFEKAEQEQLDVVAAGHSVFNEKEELLKNIEWTICDDFLAQQLGECDSSHYSAYLFKKDFIATIPHRQEFGARDDRQFIIEVALKKPKYGSIKTITLAHRIHSNDKLQKVNDLEDQSLHLTSLKIYQRAFNTLQNRGELNARYLNASLKVLIPLMHWIAKKHIKEANEILQWIKSLQPDFKFPENQVIHKLYNKIGFKPTEHLLRVRRLLKNPFS